MASSSPTLATDSFTLRPVADTFVDSATPATAYGEALSGWTDASPTRQFFLRFEVTGIDGRSVRNVRLRLYDTDPSASGGRVQWTVGDWDESTTWSTRPALTGSVLGAFGAVSSARWYEVDMGTLVPFEDLVAPGSGIVGRGRATAT